MEADTEWVPLSRFRGETQVRGVASQTFTEEVLASALCPKGPLSSKAGEEGGGGLTGGEGRGWGVGHSGRGWKWPILAPASRAGVQGFRRKGVWVGQARDRGPDANVEKWMRVHLAGGLGRRPPEYVGTLMHGCRAAPFRICPAQGWPRSAGDS